jgi:hypothetical protein
MVRGHIADLPTLGGKDRTDIITAQGFAEISSSPDGPGEAENQRRGEQADVETRMRSMHKHRTRKTTSVH